MTAGSIPRRYARALLDLGSDQGNYEALGREVGAFAAAMKTSPDLVDALTNPVFGRAQRRKVIDAILGRTGASPTTKNFFYLLLDRERLVFVPDIARELDAMIDEKAGRVHAEVTSAQPLSPAHEQQLKTSLERLSGKTVLMTKKHDPALLGGVVAQLGDVVYDGSLKNQLQRLREQLTK